MISNDESADFSFGRIHSGAHVDHTGIEKREGCHCLHHYHGSWNNDGVMSSLYLYFYVFPGAAHSLLLLEDGRSGFDVSAQKNGRTVADSAENPSGMICFFA